MNTWQNLLKPPLTLAKGVSMTQLGGSSGRSEHSFQMEQIQLDPADGVSCNSSASVQWGESKRWGLFGRTLEHRQLSVEDKDADKNLRVNLERASDGRAELSVINDSPSGRTELRFPLGLVTQLYAEEVANLTSLRAGQVTASYAQNRLGGEEASVKVGEQAFLLSDGHLKRA